MRQTRSSSSSSAAAASAAAGAKQLDTMSPPPPRKRPRNNNKRADAPKPTPTLPATPLQQQQTNKKPKQQQQKPPPSSPSTPADPFPNWPRPTPAEAWAVRDALAELHGEPSGSGGSSGSSGGDGCSAAAGGSVLGSLVRTILSQNTTDATSARAYAALRHEFGGGDGNDNDNNSDADAKERALWERVRTAPRGRLEDAIRVGGLADIKAARIRAILDTLVAEEQQEQEEEQQQQEPQGARRRPLPPGPSLERLRAMPDEEAKARLLRFNGVGPKSAACVLMFALGRAEFAVDTHVLHVAARAPLRWVPASATREQAYAHLNARVPAGCKVALHVLLVEHGKRCPSCAKGGRLATTKGGGGWLETEKGRAAAEALARGEGRCPLARAVASSAGAAAAAGGGGGAVVKKEEEEVSGKAGVVVAAAVAPRVVKKEEE